MTNVSIYARESSDDTTKAPPVEKQLERGREWARENGHVVVREYVDNGWSGGNWNRPDWNQAIRDAKRHLFTIIWTWNQDRLARDTEQFLFFCRTMKEAHCQVYEDTAREFIDMDTLGGRMKHQTLAMAAEVFRLVTSDKVKQAYRRKKQNDPWGRPSKYIDMDRAEELRAQGYGWRKIAAELGNVSHNTVAKAFKNRVKSERQDNLPEIDEKSTILPGDLLNTNAREE